MWVQLWVGKPTFTPLCGTAWRGRGWKGGPPVVLDAAPWLVDGGGAFCSLDSIPHPLHQELYLCSSQVEKSINSFSHRKSVSSGRPWGICLQSLISVEGSLSLVTQASPALCNPMDGSPPGSSVHGDSPGKNTGVGCQALLQGIFPTQGSNSGLPHCRRILYQLSHQGSPRSWQGQSWGGPKEADICLLRTCLHHDFQVLDLIQRWPRPCNRRDVRAGVEPGRGHGDPLISNTAENSQVTGCWASIPVLD